MTTDIARSLRVAADYIGNTRRNFSYAADLREEADRLDRAAADDADLDEAVKCALAAYSLHRPEPQLQQDAMLEGWKAAARVMRDRYRMPPFTERDVACIGRKVAQWWDDHLIRDDTDEVAYGRFVIHLVGGSTDTTSP